ncbi:hypothetical protein JCM1393_19920 [Clostridium carnis]
MNKLELYLIRHGMTKCNEKKLYCGHSDVSLSENGIIALKKIKKDILIKECERYFTSGFKRTNETLEILFKKLEYKVIAGFSEYNFGDFEMKSYNDLKEDKAYINWIMDNVGDVKCPNGESKAEYRKRVEDTFNSFIEKLYKDNVNSALLVTHGGTIGTILEIFYDNSKNYYDYQPKCGCGYKLIIENKENNKYKIKEIEKIGW